MAKLIRCAELLGNCAEVVMGRDVADVMFKAEEHIRAAHGMVSPSPELLAEIEAAIEDVADVTIDRAPLVGQK